MSAWGWPQWVIVGCVAWGVLTSIAKDGEPKGDYNAGFAIADGMILAWLLWMGGFWG
jgi:hypothetical protein